MLEGPLELAFASPWAYAAILAVAALDALVPLVPSEATLISAGVLAGVGDLSLACVIASGAAGAFAGDNGAYSLGRVLGPRLEGRIPRRRRAWARDKLATRGGTIVLLARFVPGGRTATTATAGLVGMRRRSFLVFSALAAAAWASFAALLGFAGGKSFEDDPHLAFVLAFGVAGGFFVALEAGRRLRLRRDPAKSPIRSSDVDPRFPA